MIRLIILLSLTLTLVLGQEGGRQRQVACKVNRCRPYIGCSFKRGDGTKQGTCNIDERCQSNGGCTSYVCSSNNDCTGTAICRTDTSTCGPLCSANTDCTSEEVCNKPGTNAASCGVCKDSYLSHDCESYKNQGFCGRVKEQCSKTCGVCE